MKESACTEEVKTTSGGGSDLEVVDEELLQKESS